MTRAGILTLSLLSLWAAGCSVVPEDDLPAAVQTFAASDEPTPTPSPPSEPAAPTPAPTPTAPAAPTTTPTPVDPLELADGQAPEVPADPTAIAGLLTAAEERIRDESLPAADIADAAHWQQLIYRRLAEQPELVQSVVGALPSHLQPVAEANVFAAARLRDLHSGSDPEGDVAVRDLPAWQILEPAPAEELLGHYAEAEAATGVHWSYLAAVNLVETRMGRIRGDSSAGAQGPMQFRPATWAEWGEGDVNNPRDAILAAGRYLAWGGMPGDVDGALFRYNRDQRYVDAVRTYAEQMQADPRAYHGYHHWQVYFDTGAEHVWLPVGYGAND